MTIYNLTFVTLGVSGLDRSAQFYADALGLTPAPAPRSIRMFQMLDLVLSLFARDALAADMGRNVLPPRGGATLAVNVGAEAEVGRQLDRIVAAGSRLAIPAAAPSHGGLRGYAEDPDGHPWEVAWHPALIPDPTRGLVL